MDKSEYLPAAEPMAFVSVMLTVGAHELVNHTSAFVQDVFHGDR